MARYNFKNRKFPVEFKDVANYIKQKKGVSVSLGKNTTFKGHFSREITIHHNYDLKSNGLYVLLRKCGEVFQPPLTDDMDLYHQCLRELDAWDRGLDIAKKLKLNIDTKKYRSEQSRIFTEKFLK